MPKPVDVVVLGGGLIGLAAARVLSAAHPGKRIIVLEKEAQVVSHQSGRNSGVMHAGIYYQPGSLKARLCRSGKADLETYARNKGIPVEQSGKLIVALSGDEIGRLDELERRARANGVPGLRRIPGNKIPDIEPDAAGVAALHSPTTAVVDFRTVGRSLVEDLEAAGAEVRTGVCVLGMEERNDGVALATSRGEVSARIVLVCAGLHADRMARMAGLDPGGRIVPFKGRYYRLKAGSGVSVRGNIYPVPNPKFPFLGVHLTRRIDGEIWIGPTATLATGREAYRFTELAWRDLGDALGFGGLYRFLARNRSAVLREFPAGISKRLYSRQVCRYLPGVTAEDLESGPSGIRAQFMTRDGRLVDDFAFAESARMVHVLNAPSPAATAALSIGKYLASKVEQRLS